MKELCDAAHKREIKIDLYFSHPDWYDADFRPYVAHPLQIPSSTQWMTQRDVEFTRQRLGNHAVIVPDPTDAEVKRMMERHRAQLVELLTNYGKIDMMVPGHVAWAACLARAAQDRAEAAPDSA